MEDNDIYKEKENTLLTFIASEDYTPLKRKEIRSLMSVPSKDTEMFNDLIDDLIEKGRLVETKKGKIFLAKNLDIYPGAFVSHSRGFGFVVLEEGEGRDIFIPQSDINGAMNKDKVLCKIISPAHGNKRAEGGIIKILKRDDSNIVGYFEKVKGFGFVKPDDKRITRDIFIPKECAKGAVTGHKVVVKIKEWPDDQTKNPEGEVVEILGHMNDPGVDILSVVRQHELPDIFSEEIYNELETIENEIPQSEIDRREDLRQVQMVTIDGEDAKDLDDAVSLSMLENRNYCLGVHIADVTHYVKENSALDKEALKRGTSVYLLDRVIPMLPHKLSNGICSLNPREDRLALSCIMEIDKNGDVVSQKVAKSVIRTDERMTYADVSKIVYENDEALKEKYSSLKDMFLMMEELKEVLYKKRKNRGAIDFDFPESKIILDSEGKTIDIKPYDRDKAMGIIEEFMLVCNETVAETYYWQEIPFVFRNHETPDSEKIKDLETFIGNLGYRIKGKGNVYPKALQKLLNDIKGKPEENIISHVALRSMKQAKYMGENLGHFGLAAKYYCHFTSPIRRYPDLQIHRIIKENIDTGLSSKRLRYLNKNIPETAKHCSVRERVAEETEREVEKLKKVEFMVDKVGEVYEGIISGVTNWGVYVELSNTIEGMVSVAEIKDDYYVFDEGKMMLIGERTKKTYKLGSPVKVKVERANLEMREIDFSFVRN